jgi:hypothetical protein
MERALPGKDVDKDVEEARDGAEAKVVDEVVEWVEAADVWAVLEPDRLVSASALIAGKPCLMRAVYRVSIESVRIAA